MGLSVGDPDRGRARDRDRLGADPAGHRLARGGARLGRRSARADRVDRDGVEWLLGEVGGIVLLPIAWLTIAGVIYGQAVAPQSAQLGGAVYTRARARLDTLPGRLRARLKDIWSDLIARFQPIGRAILLMWRAGPVLIGSLRPAVHRAAVAGCRARARDLPRRRPERARVVLDGQRAADLPRGAPRDRAAAGRSGRRCIRRGDRAAGARAAASDEAPPVQGETPPVQGETISRT